VRRALLEETGELYDALQAAKSYEYGDWLSCKGAMEHLSLPENCAPECFQTANQTVNAILQ
jgi:c-di-GMP-related signal transduction protein